MKKVILILAILTVSLGFSQSQKGGRYKVMDRYKVTYNNADYDVLFEFYSSYSKEKASLSTFKAKRKQLQKDLGDINTMTLIESKRNKWRYKAFFKRAKNVAYIINVSFNSEDQIDSLDINKEL